jgi:hypothetical protein
MQKRDSKGRFSKTFKGEIPEEADRNGFKEDFDIFGKISYLLWRIVPFLILAWIMWRYFKIGKILSELLIELACGENCKCDCTNKDSAQSVINGGSKLSL